MSVVKFKNLNVVNLLSTIWTLILVPLQQLLGTLATQRHMQTWFVNNILFITQADDTVFVISVLWLQTEYVLQHELLAILHDDSSYRSKGDVDVVVALKAWSFESNDNGVYV